MEQIPTTLVGWFTLFFSIVGGGIFLISKIRSNDMKILRNTNEDALRRIDQLEKQIKEVSAKIEVLEKRNKTLEDLVITALKQYFFENPTVATTLYDTTK